MYGTDNRDVLLETIKSRVGYRYPVAVFMLQADGANYFNAEMFRSYIPGIDVQRLDAGNIWWCPSSPVSEQKKIVPEAVAAVGYFHPSYGYFAHVERWEPDVADRPEDLTEAQLRPDRLLMADSWFYWWGTEAWMYNHGQRRPALHYPQLPSWQVKGVPAMAGLHQLFGDGRVEWRSSKRLGLGTLPGTGTGVARVKGYGVEATYYAVP